MKKIIKNIIMIIIAALLVVAAVAVYNFLNNEGVEAGKTLKGECNNIGELTTQEYSCTRVESFEDSREIAGMEIPFTESSCSFSYDSVTKAGIDFSDIDVDVSELTDTIEIKVPKSRIVSCDVDYDSQKIYNEKESIFTPITLKDQNGLMKDYEKAVKKEAKESGLLKKADKNAKKEIEKMIREIPEMEDYEVEFTSV
ncbi:MAG: DUF4230 domain-containing protein [Eubacteriaceae bacterium]|nr:DUF4230 domain-containing protein [Eubacteriaceae bacterium]